MKFVDKMIKVYGSKLRICCMSFSWMQPEDIQRLLDACAVTLETLRLGTRTLRCENLLFFGEGG